MARQVLLGQEMEVRPRREPGLRQERGCEHGTAPVYIPCRSSCFLTDVREGETSICFSSYLSTHWLVLVCVLTPDQTHNLGYLTNSNPLSHQPGLPLVIHQCCLSASVYCSHLQASLHLHVGPAPGSGQLHLWEQHSANASRGLGSQ